MKFTTLGDTGLNLGKLLPYSILYNMYNVYAYYSRAMFVYVNCLLFKSISLLPFFHFITLFPFFPLLPFLFLLPFSLLVGFPTSLSFPFYPSFISYPSIPSNLSISSYLLFPKSSPSFLLIPTFLARLLPVQPLSSFLFLH